jgi:hypothetical protein
VDDVGESEMAVDRIYPRIVQVISPRLGGYMSMAASWPKYWGLWPCKSS